MKLTEVIEALEKDRSKVFKDINGYLLSGDGLLYLHKDCLMLQSKHPQTFMGISLDGWEET